MPSTPPPDSPTPSSAQTTPLKINKTSPLRTVNLNLDSSILNPPEYNRFLSGVSHPNSQLIGTAYSLLKQPTPQLCSGQERFIRRDDLPGLVQGKGEIVLVARR
jgi:hypothetical protein